jgi:hypothetical protein
VHNYSQIVQSDAPYLYYRLDAPNYTAPDSSSYPLAVNYGSLGPNANGLYQPGTLPAVAGPAGAGFGPASRAVAINGLNSCVDIPYSSLLDPTGQTPFSITAWFKGNPADGAGRWEGIFGHNDQSWRFQMNNTVPYFDFGGNFAGLAPDVSIPSASLNPNDGNWHFCAGTYDGYTYTIYVDTFVNSLTSGFSIPGTNLDILIGGAPGFTDFGENGGFNERYFPGSIAQVAFFTNALTAAQIAELYTNATTVTPPAISLTRSGANVVITYTGTLLSSTNVAGPYAPVPGATSPYTNTPSAGSKFFRSGVAY